MRWLVVFALSGCSSVLGIEDFKLGDAGGDSMRDSAEMGYCLGPAGFRVCLMAEPTNAPVNITSSLTLDTVSSALCAGQQPASWKAAGQPDACFIISTQVSFGAPVVQVTGGRPLVVFASDSITVTTQLDASSHATVKGPAVPASVCVPPQAAGQVGTTGGGAAGGAFGTQGGDGGNGTGNAPGGKTAPRDAQPPTLLRGGCNGGVGGTGSQPGGVGGAGGGAVYLVAGNRISINGVVSASGSGGGGAGQNAGGGGGGSGGMILLHAPMITGNGGVLVANGGGGGGGGSPTQAGSSGSDPSMTNPTAPAGGGIGQGVTNNGGAGFAGGTNAANGQNATCTASSCGGGGGGGGGGFIRANVSFTQIQSSPAVSIVP